MLTKKLLTPAILSLAVILLAIVALAYIPTDQVEAAPPAVPTPITVTYSADNTGTIVKFWADGTVITQDGASTAFQLGQSEALDIQYALDQGTSVNTTTFTLQFSNDNSNWTNGVDIVASNAADATNLLQFNNFGAYTRVWANVATTDPLTLTNFSALPRR